MTISINLYETMAIVSLIFILGTVLKKHVNLLVKYCIPPAIVGGLIFSLVMLGLKLANLPTLSLDTTLQPIFMTAFFTSIGFTASFKVLKRGGKQVIFFLMLAALLIVIQNLVGTSIATLFDLNPLLGLATGSIPMVGGHGTAGSFGPMLEQLGVENATTVSVASATFGLIMGSVTGGLVAKQLINKKNIQSTSDTVTEANIKSGESKQKTELSVENLTKALLLLFIAMGIGSVVSALIQATGLTFPSYIGAMLVAAAIRNIADLKGFTLVESEIQVIGNVSLSFFLTMALMTLELWQLFDLALPLIVMLVAQVIVVATFAYFMTFRVMGRSYEAVVFASATCGFGMGATPNAIANMDELTSRYGMVQAPYFVVPLVGGLFVDFFNSGIITLFINILQ